MVLIGFRVPAAQTAALRADPAKAGELAEDGEPDLDLDKIWHLLHFVLTGTAWEVGAGAGAAILGGEEIGEDRGYGRPRLLTPEAVRAVAAGLDALRPAELHRRYDPRALAAADIYPNCWDDPNWGDFDGIVVPFLTDLRRFYRSAAEAGQAVVLAMT